MRRLTAILLGISLIGAAGRAPRMHVHAYPDRDDHEHRHAAAAHDHPRPLPALHAEAHTASVGPIDPGESATRVSFVCPLVSHVQVVAGVLMRRALVEAQANPGGPVEIVDVRVHGPPPRSQAPPRAPPLTLPDLSI